jgi:hypothetical protein
MPWSEERVVELKQAPQLLWLAMPQDPFSDGRPAPAAYEVLAGHPRAVVVAGREPYCLAHYPASVPRLAAWGTQAPHLRAVTRWLAGEIAAQEGWPRT